MWLHGCYIKEISTKNQVRYYFGQTAQDCYDLPQDMAKAVESLQDMAEAVENLQDMAETMESLQDSPTSSVDSGANSNGRRRLGTTFNIQK